MDQNNVLGLWEELKSLVESVEPDVVKNARGVAAAGVRARRGLRAVKSKVSDLIKVTISNEKSKKEDVATPAVTPVDGDKGAKSSNVKTKKLSFKN